MARAFEFFCVAVSARVVPPLEIGINYLVRRRDNRPARLGLPRSSGQRRSEDLGCCQYLRPRFEFGLLARQVGGEVLVEVRGVEVGEAVVRLLYRSFLLRGGAGHVLLLSKGALVLSDVGSVRSDVHKSDDIRMDAGLGDDRAAVAVTDEDARTFLQIEDTLSRRNVIFQRGQRFLNDADVVAVLNQSFVNWFLTEA